MPNEVLEMVKTSMYLPAVVMRRAAETARRDSTRPTTILRRWMVRGLEAETGEVLPSGNDDAEPVEA